jgi:hypothetical protein
MRLFLLLLLSFLAAPEAGLATESDPLSLAGTRARLSAPPLGPRKQAGTVVEVRGDTLLFAADRQSERTLVPTASLTGLEVSRGMHSHVWKGVGIGFLAGALAGGVIGYSLAHTPPSDDGDYGPLGGAVGAVILGSVGIAAGAIIGSRQTERWEPLRLPVHLGLLPGTNAVGFLVQVARL